MSTYSAIANSEIAVNAPVTNALMTKIRDNPLAIQQGDATASGQRIQTNAYADLSVTSVKMANGVFTEAKLDATIGAWIELQAISASGIQYASFTGISSTYDIYKLVFWGVNSVNNNNIIMQMGISSGFLASGYNYFYNDKATDGTSGAGNITGSSLLNIKLINISFAGSKYAGEINFLSPSSADRTVLNWDVTADKTSITYQAKGFGVNSTTSAMDRIRVGITAGTMSGEFRLYGMKT